MNIELERQWLYTLRLRWDDLNLTYLENALKPPQIVLDDAKQRLGMWDRVSRTISISRAHIKNGTWSEVEDTLRHEMAHQVVCEAFEAPEAPPHGALFRRACEMLGLGGSPKLGAAMAPEHVRVLQRVQKLLNLSQSQNQHEAQLAILAANRLLLQHNLSHLDTQSTTDLHWRFIGRASGRVSLAQKLIAGILQEFFFVRCVWVGTQDAKFRSVKKLEIFGRRHNLDLASYTYDFLTNSLHRLWLQYRQQTGAKGAAVKNEFSIGVLTGLKEQLDAQRETNVSQGLIWLGDPAVDELIQQRHGRLRRGRGGRYRIGKAHNAGREEGLKLRITPGLQSQAKTNRGRLLGK